MSRGKKNIKKQAPSKISTQIDAVMRQSEATSRAQLALESNGGKVYLVGGAVRDLLKDTTPKDLDLLVQALPLELAEEILTALPGRMDKTGRRFGVLRYKFRKDEVEIALPRTDYSFGPTRKEFNAVSDHRLTVEEDLKRRDFTVNAIAWDFANQKLVDPFGGQKDLREKVLRTVSPESFSQDAIRIVRGLVAVARHDLIPTDDCKDQMKKWKDNILLEPVEGVREELDKLFKAANLVTSLSLAEETGVREVIWPLMTKAQHEEGIRALNQLDANADADFKLAAYLHAMSFEDVTQQLGHDPDDQVKRIGLMYPLKRVQSISRILQAAQESLPKTPIEAKEWLAKHENSFQGAKALWNFTDIHDAKSSKIASSLIESVLDTPYKINHLDIRGNALMTELDITPGPIMGELLNHLVEEVRRDESLNKRDKLIAIAAKWHENQN